MNLRNIGCLMNDKVEWAEMSMVGWVAWIDPTISLAADTHLEEECALMIGPKPAVPTELIWETKPEYPFHVSCFGLTLLGDILKVFLDCWA